MDIDGIEPEMSKSFADLIVRAMMFDMEVDWETGLLIPRVKDSTSQWLQNWKDKERNADRQPEDYEGGKDER